MKQTPELIKIQENMRPGVISLEGFLGSDPRPLIDILTEDDAAVTRLGLSHRQIAERMKEFRDAGKKGLGEFITFNGNYEVKVDDVRGKLPSPFGGKGVFPKTNITVRNKALNKELTFSELQIHMIEENGFYEGRGGHYRLEPKELAEILGIKSREEIVD